MTRAGDGGVAAGVRRRVAAALAVGVAACALSTAAITGQSTSVDAAASAIGEPGRGLTAPSDTAPLDTAPLDTAPPPDTTVPTEPDDTAPEETTEPDDTLVGAGDPDPDIDGTVAAVAVVGFVLLVGLASWWMVRRSNPDAEPMPPVPPSTPPPSDLI